MKIMEKESKAADIVVEVEKAPPCGMVIFGASGDLTRRLLMPAIYQMEKYGVLPQQSFILGTAQQEFSDVDFRTQLRKEITQTGFPIEEKIWEGLSQRLYYLPGNLKDPQTHQAEDVY